MEKLKLEDLLNDGASLAELEAQEVGSAADVSDKLTLPGGVYYGRFLPVDVKDVGATKTDQGIVITSYPVTFQALYATKTKEHIDRQVRGGFYLYKNNGEESKPNKTRMKLACSHVIAAYNGSKQAEALNYLNENQISWLKMGAAFYQDPEGHEQAPVVKVYLRETPQTEEYDARNEIDWRKGVVNVMAEWVLLAAEDEEDSQAATAALIEEYGTDTVANPETHDVPGDVEASEPTPSDSTVAAELQAGT